MKPILVIPSYKRPNAKIFEKLSHISLDKFVFIRQEEYLEYLPVKRFGFHIIKLKSVYDIGETRKLIVSWCNIHNYEWVFMFDDDISKVERLSLSLQGKINSKRIIDGATSPPRFESKALKEWFNLATVYNLSLSSPNHRAYDRFFHGKVRINRSACIQCVLIHVPDIVFVGNYKSLRETGNEDYFIQYKLMSSGFLTGKIGSIEYDCPSVGVGSGGNNAEEYSDINERYELYTQTFLQNVCNDSRLIKTKTTKSGQKSISFVWKNWPGKEIQLPEFKKEEN